MEDINEKQNDIIEGLNWEMCTRDCKDYLLQTVLTLIRVIDDESDRLLFLPLGLFRDVLDDIPHDKHLLRLAKCIGREFPEFIIHLGLTRVEWEDIEDDRIFPDRLTQKVIALSKCINRRKTFRDVAKALTHIEYSEHYLCMALREDDNELNASLIGMLGLSVLMDTPSDVVLEQLSYTFGNYAVILGIELEIAMDSILQIIYTNFKDMFGQNLDILLKWKIDGKNTSIYFLMKAFRNVDRRGLLFLLKTSANSCDSFKMKQLISKGKYKSYSNVVYMGGACNVGKTTLASILIGEDIPVQWNSTNGLEIYVGRNGINLETKEMVQVKKDSGREEILASVLRGHPNVSKISEDNLKLKPHLSKTLETAHEKSEANDTNSINSADAENTNPMPMTQTVSENENSSKNKNATHSSSALKPRNIKKLSAISLDTLNDEIKGGLIEGRYQVRIAPSDLVDFGGQRSFDMTHQLFIRQKGVFVLMIDGRKNLDEILKEYPQGDINGASIFEHWANSILTYCGIEDEDILPSIIFVATHSDSFPGKELEIRKLELINQISDLFRDHEQRDRILRNSLYFINGKDEEDNGIKLLKKKLVEIAFQQKTWGQEMPVAFVPLELQFSEMRRSGINIISAKEVFDLNDANQDFTLTNEEVEFFLSHQHSLGKIMYFKLPGLDTFIITQPIVLVHILRSFITDHIFWPEDKNLRTILETLTKTGRITTTDLYQLWLQEEFNKHIPTEALKMFLVNVLVHLDILVKPKRFREAKIEEVDPFYLVPCIVSSTVRRMTLTLEEGKTICLSYKLFKSSVPSALSYKLIGALLNIWPVKKIGQSICLFHQAATMSVDEDNDLTILTKSNQILLFLRNKVSSRMISPDIASVVEECVTETLEKVMKFYQESFGKIVCSGQESLFEKQVGEMCNTEECLISVREAHKQMRWQCKHGKEHTSKICLKWIKKKSSDCLPECEGEEEPLVPTYRHLAKLGSLMPDNKMNAFVLNLGLTQIEWESIVTQFQGGLRYHRIMPQFQALCECRRKKERHLKKLTFKDLSKALEEVDFDKHILCKLLEEEIELYDMSTVEFQKTPSKEVLLELSQKIAACEMLLGIELGLDIAVIERIIIKYNKDPIKQNYKILLKWKDKGTNTSELFLMKALQRADPRGLTFLTERHGQQTN